MPGVILVNASSIRDQDLAVKNVVKKLLKPDWWTLWQQIPIVMEDVHHGGKCAGYLEKKLGEMMAGKLDVRMQAVF